jgi:hypothetical protein
MSSKREGIFKQKIVLRHEIILLVRCDNERQSRTKQHCEARITSRQETILSMKWDNKNSQKQQNNIIGSLYKYEQQEGRYV